MQPEAPPQNLAPEVRALSNAILATLADHGATVGAPELTFYEREVLDLLRSQPRQSFYANEIAMNTTITPHAVPIVCASLVRFGLAQPVGQRQHRATTPAR